jgi:hypothetical protein
MVGGQPLRCSTNDGGLAEVAVHAVPSRLSEDDPPVFECDARHNSLRRELVYLQRCDRTASRRF